MACLFFDGFESPISPLSSQQHYHHTNGSPTPSSSIKRTGDYSLKINPTLAATAYVEISKLPANGVNAEAINLADCWITFYFRPEVLPASSSELIFRASDSSHARKFEVALRSTGLLQYNNSAGSQVGVGSITLVSGTWYRIDIKVGTGTSSTCTVRVDEVVDFTSTTVNTLTNNNGYMLLGKPFSNVSQTIEYYYDDVWLDSAQWKAGGVYRIDVDGNKNPQMWTGGTGLSGYLEIDETPPDTTTYVQSNGPGESHFTFESMVQAGIPARGIINAVSASSRCIKTTAGVVDFLMSTSCPGQNFGILVGDLSNSFYQDCDYLTEVKSAASAPYTYDDLDALFATLEYSMGSGQIRCTRYCLFVHITPGAPTSKIMTQGVD